jgi:hypothetical protein
MQLEMLGDYYIFRALTLVREQLGKTGMTYTEPVLKIESEKIYLGGRLSDTIERLQALKEKHPDGRIEVHDEDNYFSYFRPETEMEANRRIEHQKKRDASLAASRRDLYENLKKEFE